MLYIYIKCRLVVGGECVFTQNDTIDSTEFDNTTQICCSRSGVHDRYQQGQEVDCCGGKNKRIYMYFTKIRALISL